MYIIEIQKIKKGGQRENRPTTNYSGGATTSIYIKHNTINCTIC